MAPHPFAQNPDPAPQEVEQVVAFKGLEGKLYSSRAAALKSWDQRAYDVAKADALSMWAEYRGPQAYTQQEALERMIWGGHLVKWQEVSDRMNGSN